MDIYNGFSGVLSCGKGNYACFLLVPISSITHWQINKCVCIYICDLVSMGFES